MSCYEAVRWPGQSLGDLAAVRANFDPFLYDILCPPLHGYTEAKLNQYLLLAQHGDWIAMLRLAKFAPAVIEISDQHNVFLLNDPAADDYTTFVYGAYCYMTSNIGSAKWLWTRSMDPMAVFAMEILDQPPEVQAIRIMQFEDSRGIHEPYYSCIIKDTKALLRQGHTDPRALAFYGCLMHKAGRTLHSFKAMFTLALLGYEYGAAFILGHNMPFNDTHIEHMADKGMQCVLQHLKDRDRAQELADAVHRNQAQTDAFREHIMTTLAPPPVVDDEDMSLDALFSQFQ